MTPKEKAEELYYKYYDKLMIFSYKRIKAKRCALITVDEMIIQNGELYLNGLDSSYYRQKNAYLFEVKQEIEKL